MIIATLLLSVEKPITLKTVDQHHKLSGYGIILLGNATNKLLIGEILRSASYSVKLKEQNLF